MLLLGGDYKTKDLKMEQALIDRMSLLDKQKRKLEQALSDLDSIESVKDLEKRVSDVESAASDGTLKMTWQESAAYGRAKDKWSVYESAIASARSAIDFANQAEDEDDDRETVISMALEDITRSLESVTSLILEESLSGMYDPNNAIVTVRVGEGSHEDIYARIAGAYGRFAESKGWSVEEIDIAPDQHVTIRVCGENAYGLLRGEHGRHKYVFKDRHDKKQTGYLGVTVEPEVESGLGIDESKIEARWFGASSPGGQHANKSSNCVELSYPATPQNTISATARGRSRSQNLSEAKKVLLSRVRLWYEDQAKTEQTVEQVDLSRGPAIRVYELTRNQVIDLRGDIRARSNPDKFFQGDIYNHIAAYHGMKVE